MCHNVREDTRSSLDTGEEDFWSKESRTAVQRMSAAQLQEDEVYLRCTRLAAEAWQLLEIQKIQLEEIRKSVKVFEEAREVEAAAKEAAETEVTSKEEAKDGAKRSFRNAREDFHQLITDGKSEGLPQLIIEGGSEVCLEEEVERLASEKAEVPEEGVSEITSETVPIVS